VSNPPYISESDYAELPRDVRDFEPRSALAGGPDGLDVVRALTADAVRVLSPGGVLALEIGAGQAADAREILHGAGFTEIETARDYARHERVVSGARSVL
jgi:release factor glutamine methyltransferase